MNPRFARQNMIACTCAAIFALGCATVQAQPYPSRPVRLIVPYAPGGPTDTVGRLVAQKLGERVGVTVVVDNRPGATGILGGQLVAKAAADGYTLLLCSTSTLVTSPLLASSAPYDGRRDFAPITLIAVIPYMLLVSPTSGMTSVKDLVAAAKAKPGTMNYGSAGTASTSHLAGALLGKLAAIDITHVPYKGSAPAAVDLIGGRLQLIFEATAAAMPYVKSGRLRALGVSTPARVPSLPELTTIAEAGVPGYEMSTWHGICAPRGTPSAIVDRLNREIVSTMNAPDARERLANMGVELVGSSPKDFGALINAEVPRLDKLMREIGVK